MFENKEPLFPTRFLRIARPLSASLLALSLLAAIPGTASATDNSEQKPEGEYGFAAQPGKCNADWLPTWPTKRYTCLGKNGEQFNLTIDNPNADGVSVTIKSPRRPGSLDSFQTSRRVPYGGQTVIDSMVDDCKAIIVTTEQIPSAILDCEDAHAE